MKKFALVLKRMSALMLAVVVFCSISTFAFAKDDELELNVYNWGEYIDDGTDEGASSCAYSQDVIKAFEEYYKNTYGKTVKVNYSTFENNESLYTKLKMGGANYDVIVPSDYMINRFIKEGMLEELDFSNIPNYANIADTFKGDAWNYDPDHKYSVPYLWGTVGIVYNSEYVFGDVSTWNALWNEEYKNKILMFNNPRDTFAIALAKLSSDKNNQNITINTNDLTYWDEAYKLLEEQKPLVQAYVTDEVFNKMEKGEAWLAPCYYGDALVMMENNDKLKFTSINNSIANKYVDAFCIPKGAKNKKLAEEFINFMCTKEISFANACYTGYSSPNKLVTEDSTFPYYQDPNGYPADHRLENSYEEFLWLNPETQAKMDELWGQLKKAELGFLKWIVIIVIALVIIALVYVIITRIKKGNDSGLYEDDEDEEEEKTPVLSRKEQKLAEEQENYSPILAEEDKLE